MSLAARTREALREQPFLLDALRAGVVNYTALARHLDVGDPEAVAAALRRFAEDLDARPASGKGRVRMKRGIENIDTVTNGEANSETETGTGTHEKELLRVQGQRFGLDGGSLTAILAAGEPDPIALARALARCNVQDIDVRAAGIADALVVVVDQRDGPDALRAIEGVFDQ